MADKPKPIKELSCACCGSIAIGRQWFNQDTGYGICSQCIAWMREKKTNGEPRETEEAIRDYYGVEGKHFNVKKNEVTA